jgi:hypothetical protein
VTKLRLSMMVLSVTKDTPTEIREGPDIYIGRRGPLLVRLIKDCRHAVEPMRCGTVREIELSRRRGAATQGCEES